MIAYEEHLLTVRVPVDDTEAIRGWLTAACRTSPALTSGREVAVEYLGVFHHTDRWFDVGDTSVFVREQALAPPARVHVHRAGGGLARETHHVEALALDAGDRPRLPAELVGVAVRRSVRVARELWLAGNLRICLDTVACVPAGGGQFLYVEAVVDDTHPEAVCERAIAHLLDALGLARPSGYTWYADLPVPAAGVASGSAVFDQEAITARVARLGPLSEEER